MRPQLKIIAGSLLLLFVIVETLNHTLTKNISISEPIGYYLKLPIIGTIKHGNKYLICISDIKYIVVLKQLGLPNSSNQCPYNSPYLIKQVAGVPGDIVEVTQPGILINNQLQLNSQSFTSAHDVNLYPLPVGYKIILRKNEYFMLGNTPHSVDSRYFGVINRNQFYKQPILIFKESIP
jgi:signal peptidase I